MVVWPPFLRGRWEECLVKWLRSESESESVGVGEKVCEREGECVRESGRECMFVTLLCGRWEECPVKQLESDGD